MFQLSSILCSDPKNVSLSQGVGNKIGQKWPQRKVYLWNPLVFREKYSTENSKNFGVFNFPILLSLVCTNSISKKMNKRVLVFLKILFPTPW